MATRQAVNNTRATTPVSVPEITRIQVEGNDTVSFLYGLTPPYQWVRGMSQIMTQNPAYISYRYDTITISQVAGESFSFTVYSITDVGGNTFTALTSLDTSDIVAAKTQEIYRLLVTSVFKGCCECGNTEPECSIQYTAGTDPTIAGTLWDVGGVGMRINYFTANSQDFTGFWPIIQDGSWIFVFSKTDPTVYGVYQLSGYTDGGTFAQFNSTLLAGPAGFPDGTSLCVDVTSVGGSLVQDWQDTLNISSLLTQNNLIDGGGFNFEWENVNRYILNSFGYQSYISTDGFSTGQVYINPGSVSITGTNFIDVITPGWATATPGMVLALDSSGHVEYTLAGTGTISSIGLNMPPAFTVSTPNPLTSNGSFTVDGAGTDLEYINGLGELATLPVYTVENGLHAFGGVPGEAPPDPFLFHLGGVLIEDTVITATDGTDEYVLGIAGTANQNTRRPLSVSNLGLGGAAVFSDFSSGFRPHPTVQMITDNDLFEPILELTMQGDLPNPNPVLTDRIALLRLKYDGDPALARMSIDYQFKNDDVSPNPIYFIGGRLTTEVTNFTANAEQTKFTLQLFNNGSRQNKLEMSGPGQLKLNTYVPGAFVDNTLDYVLAVNNTGEVFRKFATGGGTVVSVDATGLLTTSPDPITVSGTVSSEMNSGFLVGRYDAGLGVFQEITVGTGLTLSATGELSADGSVPAYDGDQGVYKDTSLTNDTFMLGAPSGSQGTIPFTIDRYISVTDKRLQMEGTSEVLKLIEGSAALASRSSTLEVTAENNYRAAQFTSLNNETVRITTYGNSQALWVLNENAANTIWTAAFVNNYGGGIDVKSKTSSRFYMYQSSPSSITNAIDIQNFPSAGPYTAGQGNSITFQPGVDLGNNTIANGTVLNSVFSDVAAGAAVVDFRVDTFNAGSPLVHSTFIGDGQLRLHEYGQTPANFPDASPVWALGVDASGNVVEFTPSGGGTTYDGKEGIYKDTSVSPDTFQLGAPSGSQAGIAFSIDRYIDTSDQFLQIEGANGEDGSIVLKVIEGSGIPVDTKASFISATQYKKYAGSFTGHFSSALLAYSTADGNTLEVTNAGPGGLAAIFQSENGPGIQIISLLENQFQINGGSSTTPAIYPILDLENLSNLITPANGEGVSITMSPGVDAFGTIDVGVSLNAVISDIGTVVGNDSVVDFRVDTLNLGTVQQHTSFIGDGQLKLHEYGQTPANFPDASPVWALGVDSTGNVVEFTPGGSSPLTTKGDLYTFDTADARLPVGTDGQMLYADSTTATGLKWDDAPTGGGIPFGIATGTDTYAVSAGTASTYTDGDAYLVRFTNGNTGASTLNVNSIGAANMYSNSDGLLIGGDIWAESQMLCVYDSSLPGFKCIGTSTNSLFAYVTNAEATTITKGTAVYASGGTGDRMTVMKALATGDSTSALTVGMVFADIASGQKGIILIQGELVGLNLFPTSGGGENWSDGEPVYLSATTAGAVTRVKQYAPNHLVYLGICVKASNGSAGRMYVRIQNGYELDELHNVQAQSPANKDTLWYDNSVTPKQWKTGSVPSLSGTFSLGVTVDGSGGVITAGVKGYVRVPYACTINTWSILTNNAGTGATVTFDIWRANNAIPTVGGSLVGGGTKPFLTSNTAQITSATPTGWTSVTLAANDILGFNVESGAAVFSWANLQLLVTKI